jgi:uncharacterized protein (DUF305 family)
MMEAAAMPEQQRPDLQELAEKIHAAHDAEDRLMHTMPNAIPPHDEAYQGMTGASEGDVEKVDESAETDAELQAEAPEKSPTLQVEQDALDTGRKRRPEQRDDDDDTFVEPVVADDDNQPPAASDRR